MTSTRLDGKRVLLTQRFMGSALSEVFADLGRWSSPIPARWTGILKFPGSVVPLFGTNSSTQPDTSRLRVCKRLDGACGRLAYGNSQLDPSRSSYSTFLAK